MLLASFHLNMLITFVLAAVIKPDTTTLQNVR